MKKKIVGTYISLGLSVGLTGLSSVPAQAASYCSGTSYSGMCYTTLLSDQSSVVVESIPLSNTSMVDATMTCVFGQVITKTMTATSPSGVSAPASIKAGILASVDATVSLPLAMSISQSGAQANPVAAQYFVQPGQNVSCNRVYTEVTATVRVTSYSGSGVSVVGTYATKIPSGVRVENR
ncbi:hypothetical protein SAMN05216410_1892 [Sanguibacter gelidistatuariae]|uniref:SipW-cognate class signal peptide n=1 Tax=Sanguibacter gelidistatuariae TaxID=1814289 RepID=A0A1G6MIX8_9MICO|nr:hypothetical protein [Sanguibacter gelidistatuariae]SDC55492.1 hypothetical protein SAMN05216410_1892 [Sanguibacter gelidistatuariae]